MCQQNKSHNQIISAGGILKDIKNLLLRHILILEAPHSYSCLVVHAVYTIVCTSSSQAKKVGLCHVFGTGHMLVQLSGLEVKIIVDLRLVWGCQTEEHLGKGPLMSPV